MKLTVRFTRVSPTHHRFEYRCESGEWKSVLLETRSTLEHDLIHYALEREANLTHSFYGSLAASQSYAALTANGMAMAGQTELRQTERIVGVLTAAMRHSVSSRKVLDAL